MVRTIVTCLIGFWVFTGQILSQENTKERQHAALEAVLMELETHYGMSKFKEELLGVSIDEIRHKYHSLIDEAQTIPEALGLEEPQSREILDREEFEQLLITLAAEFWDGHFNILRSATSNYWTVGIFAAEIEGRLYVTGFDDEFFRKEAANPDPKVGDEVIEINGVDVQTLAQRLEPSMSLATYNSRFSSALGALLNRSHRWFSSVKEGDEVRVKFRRKNPKFKKNKKTEPEYIEFEGFYHWVNRRGLARAHYYFPDQLELPEHDPDEFIYGYSRVNTVFSHGFKQIKGHELSVIHVDELINQDIELARLQRKAEKEDREFKPKANSRRKLAKAEVERLSSLKTTNYLPVYIIRYKGKSIGVIRIPDYGFYVEEMRWLREAIRRLEKTTDVLILDQNDNGGGYVWSGAQLARLFAHDGPMDAVTIDLKLNNTLLHRLEQWNESEEDDERKKRKRRPLPQVDEEFEDEDTDFFLERNFADLKLSRDQIDELRKKFEAGEQWSGPVSYMGTQYDYREDEGGLIVGKEKVTYSKPVLLLNSCRSASCGDFFPSLMQSNGRALVRGETSMGLGGPVYRSQNAMPGSELFMRCTIGYCQRADGLPIENIGVIPDLPRWILPQDLRDNFKSYAIENLDVAVDMANGKSLKELKRRRHQHRDEPHTEAFRSVKRVMKELQRQVRAAKDDTSAAIEAYKWFFKEIQKKEYKKAKDSYWSYFEFPIPAHLYKRDLMLASLRRPDEMHSRLQQMIHLEEFSRAEDKRLIRYLIRNLPKISNARRSVCFADIQSLGFAEKADAD